MIPVSAAFQTGRKALIAYLTVGYPSVEVTMSLVPALAKAGCDAIELGVPFSDPLADGSTIQRASFAALQGGVTPARCLGVAKALAPHIDIPMLFMGYYNPILRYGIQPFCDECARAGIGGLIVPDLPPEEGELLGDAASGQGISLIYLVAPTTPPQRLQLVADRASGFLYLVSLAGVTGSRSELPPGLEDFVGRVRRTTTLPLAVGFGISTPQQAARVAGVADGVIVGSALLSVIEAAVSAGADPVIAATSFMRNLRVAIDAV